MSAFSQKSNQEFDDKYIYCPKYDLFLANIKPVLIQRLRNRLKEKQAKIAICANKIIPYIETLHKAHFLTNIEPFTDATSYEVSKIDDIEPYINTLICAWQGPIISTDYKRRFNDPEERKKIEPSQLFSNVNKFNCNSRNWCDIMAGKIEGEFFVMHIEEIKAYIRTCCEQISGISQLQTKIFINCVWCYVRYELLTNDKPLIINTILNHKPLLKSLDIFQFVGEFKSMLKSQPRSMQNNSLRTKLVTHCRKLLNDAEAQIGAERPMYCNNVNVIVPLTEQESKPLQLLEKQLYENENVDIDNKQNSDMKQENSTDPDIDWNSLAADIMHMNSQVQTENQRNVQKIKSLQSELAVKNKQINKLKQQVLPGKCWNMQVEVLEKELKDTVEDNVMLKQENEMLKELVDDGYNENDTILNEQYILDIEQIVEDEILNNQPLFPMIATYNTNVRNCMFRTPNATPNILTSSTVSSNSNDNNSSQNNQNNNNNNRPPYDGNNHGSSGGGNNNYPNSNGYYGINNILLIQQLLAIINEQQKTINAQHNTIIRQQNTIAQAQTTLNVSMHLYKQYLLDKTSPKSIKKPKRNQHIKKSKIKSTLPNQIGIRQNDQPDYVPITCNNYNNIYVAKKFADRFRERVNSIKDVENFIMSLFEKYPINITNICDKMMIDYGFVDKLTNEETYLVLRKANKCQMKQNYEYQVQLFCSHMLIYGFLRDASAFTRENAFIPLNILRLCDQYHAQFITYLNFSSISNCLLLETTSIDSIRNILKETGKDILKKCNWNTIPIICRRNNKTRKNILCTKQQFILNVSQNLCSDDITLIPIIEFCYNKYYVNFAWILRIDTIDKDLDVNIALSLHYNKKYASVKINTIYCDKNYLLQQHYLVSPKLMKDCKCLNKCNLRMDDIHIGSPDAWCNKIKRLQRIIAKKNDTIAELKSNASSTTSMMYSIPLSVPMSSSNGTMSSSPSYVQQFQVSQPSSDSMNGDIS